MKKYLNIKTKVDFEQIIDKLTDLIQAPTVNFFDLGLKKIYSGEIYGDKFWFTWSKTMDFWKNRPIVNGQISKNSNVTEIKMTLKDSTQTGLIILLTILMIPTIYFSWIIIKNKDFNGLKIIIGIILLLTAIFFLNKWRSKNGMIKMEKEIHQIFDQFRT